MEERTALPSSQRQELNGGDEGDEKDLAEWKTATPGAQGVHEVKTHY
jgi:hypothetical protein